MFSIHLVHAVLLITASRMIDSSYRKIKDGNNTYLEMRYMVYLTKAEKSTTQYDAWICGGSIVTKDFIVTSAACVEDVQFMYAIAGYKKYVNVKNIDTDLCTKACKKKVVFICVPRSYDFAYDKVEKWAFIDIAAVRVESPYDFTAPAPIAGCSWVPNKIDINYDVKYQAPNTDAMVLGWGHTLKWRQPGDQKDYNQEALQYSPILLMDKTECKNLYSKTQQLIPIIEKYMLCALNEGNINDNGELIKTAKPNANGCADGSLRVGKVCEAQTEQSERQRPIIDDPPNVQRAENPYRQTIGQNNNYRLGNDETITFEDIILNWRRSNDNTKDQRMFNYTRKAGICQNDHGGPLVTWVGKRDILIGVASVFRLDKSFNCVGPYLFTSTQCNGAFLDCVLNGNGTAVKKSRRQSNFCDLPPEKKGFDIIERRVSWRSHPDGPALNELADDIYYRPVIPLG